MRRKKTATEKFTSRRGGYVLLPAMLAFSILVLAMTALFLSPVHETYGLVRQRLQMHCARHLAGGGAEKALMEIEKKGPEYTGEGKLDLPSGSVEWYVRKGEKGALKIISLGKPNIPGSHRVMATAELTVEVKGAAGACDIVVLSRKHSYIEKD
ncbi:MAG: hypothetical protein ACYS8W_06870 [Planctomycetota bacterium]|jgi:hypothetical protein